MCRLDAAMLKTRFTDDKKVEVGIDEAGRGCFWGPIMAGAVIWPEEDAWTDEHRQTAARIKDSKKITPKRRAIIAEEIKRLAVDFAVGSVSAAEIDEHGMTWANTDAFRRAADGLLCQPDRLLVDGTLTLKYKDKEVHTVIDGDAKYIPIAAASIIAKEAHDAWVREYLGDAANAGIAEKYDLLSCKGYGTARHRAGIQTHGLHAEHRKSFIHPEGSRPKRTRIAPGKCQIIDDVKGI